MLEEDVPAHLAGQRRAGLLELGLDQRVTGAPHQRLATECANLRGHVARALDVEDDLRARLLGQHAAREQHELAVGPDDLAVLGDDTQAVTVAIERQAQLGVGLAQAADQVLQVLRVGRIRMVVGERAVDLAEQLGDLAAERAVQRWRHAAGHAVAAVDGDLHRPGKLHVAADAFQVGSGDIGLFERAGDGGPNQIAALDALAQLLQALAVQRLAAQHHLQAVVLGRVVAAGDLHARLRAQVVGGEVQHRRGHHANVDHGGPGGADAFIQRIAQARPGQPAVATDRDPRHAARYRLRAEGSADRANRVDRQRAIDNAADVVGLEDAGVDGGRGHGGLSAGQRARSEGASATTGVGLRRACREAIESISGAQLPSPATPRGRPCRHAKGTVPQATYESRSRRVSLLGHAVPFEESTGGNRRTLLDQGNDPCNDALVRKRRQCLLLSGYAG